MEKLYLFPNSFRHGCWPSLWKTMPKNISDKLHVTLWADLSALLTPDRIMVRRHVAYHKHSCSFAWAHFCIAGIFFSTTYTLCTPPSKYPLPPRNPPPLGKMHATSTIFFCFTSQLLVFRFALGRVEGQGWISPAWVQQITRSPPALHLRGRKHSNICADVCSHAGTHSNNARELRNMNTQNTYTNKVLNKQININTGKLIAWFVAVQ